MRIRLTIMKNLMKRITHRKFFFIFQGHEIAKKNIATEREFENG